MTAGSPGDVRGRVLVVEDEAVNRRILQQILDGAGLEHVAATDGEAALRIVEEGGIDLVLLDIVLPGIDGYEVIRRLRELPAGVDLPVIFISALDEVADKVKGLELGAADYVAKPFNRHEVLARVRAQLRIGQLTASLARANTELIEKQEILAEDLRAAADIQRALLPPAQIDSHGVTASSWFQPSIQVGGDVFNVFQPSDGIWVVYIADVSGHGVASALMTVSVTQRLSGPDGIARDPAASPSSIVRQLDTEYPFERMGKYFSVALAVFDCRSGTLRYTSAGHPPPFIARADGTIERLEAGGPIVGMGFGLAFEDGQSNLGLGDRLVLYTDGVTEDEDPSGEAFGIDRLEAHFASTHGTDLHQSCSSLITTLTTRRAGRPPLDDIALVAVQRRTEE